MKHDLYNSQRKLWRHNAIQWNAHGENRYTRRNEKEAYHDEYNISEINTEIAEAVEN